MLKRIRRRLSWYKLRFQLDNWYVGRLVELLGNRVRIDNVRLDVDNPLVTTRHKGSLFFGIYENAERELAKSHIDRSLPTVEIGASIGGVSCVVNKLLADPSAHVVMECNPVLLPTLRKNRELNQAKFVIDPVAIAYGASEITFSINDHFMMGGTFGQQGKQITVPATTLAEILKKYKFQTINLISDCEGAETELVDNDLSSLRNSVKCFIVEVHPEIVGTDRIAAMFDQLTSAGFVQIAKMRSSVFAFENRSLR